MVVGYLPPSISGSKVEPWLKDEEQTFTFYVRFNFSPSV